MAISISRISWRYSGRARCLGRISLKELLKILQYTNSWGSKSWCKSGGMGGLCCCFSSDNFEDYVAYPNGSIYQICPCARRCMRWFMSTVCSGPSLSADDVLRVVCMGKLSDWETYLTSIMHLLSTVALVSFLVCSKLLKFSSLQMIFPCFVDVSM